MKKNNKNGIKGVFKDGSGMAFIEKAGGRYFNNYGYDINMRPKMPASAGAYKTYAEAESMIYRHRPSAKRITRDKWKKLPGAQK